MSCRADGPVRVSSPRCCLRSTGQHQPLNRQAERFAREGVPLSVSTLADQVGAAAFALMPLYRLIEAHVLAAERLHGDDTTVLVMAKGKTDVARLWVYVRDDRPFAGTDPPRRAVPLFTRPGAASIRGHISRRGPASCRPTPMADMASSMRPAVSLARCSKRAASPTRGASSSSSPMSKARPAKRAAASAPA